LRSADASRKTIAGLEITFNRCHRRDCRCICRLRYRRCWRFDELRSLVKPRTPRSRRRVSIRNHRSAGSGGNARRAECLETNVRRSGLPTMKLVALATGASVFFAISGISTNAKVDRPACIERCKSSCPSSIRRQFYCQSQCPRKCRSNEPEKK
jgi:hypothetical protein